MRTIMTPLVLAALALGACDKKAPAGAVGGGGEAPAAEADKGPVTLDAPAFWKEYNGMKPMDAMKRYKNGVIVKGQVLRTIGEADDSLKVWLDAGDGNWISLSFVDGGKAAKGKGLAKGVDTVAKCQVGGADAKYIMLTDCDLK